VSRRAGDAIGAAGAVVFGLGSFVRGKRIVHPVGVAYDAVLAVDEPCVLVDRTVLGEPGAHAAVVRLSRGLGLPMSDPDVHGLAIRVPASDAWGEQDFLLASVRRLKSGRDLICRSQGYGTRFSTVVRFDGRDAPFVLWALPLDAVPDDAAMHAGAGEGLRFELLAATADHRRSPHRIAVVSLGTPVSPAVAESLRFDPWHRGGNVAPTGVFNTARRIVYPSSQLGRSLRGG